MNATVDVGQPLKNTENSLRDFIALILTEKVGPDWIEKCGVTPERIKTWKERKEVEAKRQQAGSIDDPLIYYADFYDLQTILRKHWQHFSEALGELKTFEVWLSELEKLRDPDAHRRELLPHQKHLALGLEGEIRTRITRYRSKLETRDDYYPRIETVRDSYGTLYVPGENNFLHGPRLRPGDSIQLVVTASDPMDEELQYRFSTIQRIDQRQSLDTGWTSENTCLYVLQEKDVGSMFRILVAIRSQRKFHAYSDEDDRIVFFYEILPPKSTV